jgi:hypothetical protein
MFLSLLFNDATNCYDYTASKIPSEKLVYELLSF